MSSTDPAPVGSAIERLSRAQIGAIITRATDGGWSCEVSARLGATQLEAVGKGATEELAALDAIATLADIGVEVPE